MGFSLFLGFCWVCLAREAGTSTSSTTVTAETNLGKKRLILIIQNSSMRFHRARLQQKCDAVGSIQSFPAFVFLRRHFPSAHGFKSEGQSWQYGRFGYRDIVRPQHESYFRGERGQTLHRSDISIEIGFRTEEPNRSRIVGVARKKQTVCAVEQ